MSSGTTSSFDTPVSLIWTAFAIAALAGIVFAIMFTTEKNFKKEFPGIFYTVITFFSLVSVFILSAGVMAVIKQKQNTSLIEKTVKQKALKIIEVFKNDIAGKKFADASKLMKGLNLTLADRASIGLA